MNSDLFSVSVTIDRFNKEKISLIFNAIKRDFTVDHDDVMEEKFGNEKIIFYPSSERMPRPNFGRGGISATAVNATL